MLVKGFNESFIEGEGISEGPANDDNHDVGVDNEGIAGDAYASTDLIALLIRDSIHGNIIKGTIHKLQI